MRKVTAAVMTACLLALSPQAFAEIVNLTNSASGTDRDAGIAAVKEKLTEACTDRNGAPQDDSFEVVFEQTSDNPDVPKPYNVDAKMQCDLPEG